MKEYSQYNYDVLPIDYNLRLILKGYKGEICTLLDFLDNDGLKYILESRNAIIDKIKFEDGDRWSIVLERYLKQFYYSYYYFLVKIVDRILDKHDCIEYYVDTL